GSAPPASSASSPSRLPEMMACWSRFSPSSPRASGSAPCWSCERTKAASPRAAASASCALRASVNAELVIWAFWQAGPDRTAISSRSGRPGGCIVGLILPRVHRLVTRRQQSVPGHQFHGILLLIHDAPPEMASVVVSQAVLAPSTAPFHTLVAASVVASQAEPATSFVASQAEPAISLVVSQVTLTVSTSVFQPVSAAWSA